MSTEGSAMPETTTTETTALVLTDTVKKRFHDMLDAILAQPDAGAFVVHVAALCPNGIVGGSAAHGLISAEDVMKVFTSGGARMLEELRSQADSTGQTTEKVQ